ncbi:MAG: RDD family protein [Candidatus Nealsonbacteria bacterium]|nr:RDD family protein [Candidatus Nealsonbacteria bacterium]
MQDQNPYESPFEVSPAPVAPQVEEMQLASTGIRFGNYILDMMFFMALALFLGLVLGVVGGEAALEAMENTPDFVFGALLLLIYYVPQEAVAGRTLAKLITGTRVVTVDGETPTFGQIIGRTFSRMIPFEPFSFLGGKFPVGWHDKLSGTRVIRSR